MYRSGTVNSKSFAGKDLLRIKWNFELTVFELTVSNLYFLWLFKIFLFVQSNICCAACITSIGALEHMEFCPGVINIVVAESCLVHSKDLSPSKDLLVKFYSYLFFFCSLWDICVFVLSANQNVCK